MKHNLNNMMALDLYLSSLNQYDYNATIEKIEGNSNDLMPLLSWDFHSESFNKQLLEAQRQQDILKVVHLAEKYHWQNDIQSIFEHNQFEALLLTNSEQRIVWVNDGFTTMTGYLKKDVIHKTPRILQGRETSTTSRERIREKLIANLPFTEIITNYKKDGLAYKCEVKIFPLKRGKTTHYLALEKQVV
jgi:PAS domain S-box-containing protein